MRRWLLKSEPGDYAIDDLARDRRDWWTGVRNYQARNFRTRDMQVGDGALFYHSNCAAPGVYGIAKICAAAAPDKTQFDPKSKYYDPRATRDKPRWFCVQVQFVRKLRAPRTLAEMRKTPALSAMHILRRGCRLSITPVSESEWQILAGR